MQKSRKYFKKNGIRVAQRGVKLTRKKKFEAELETKSGVKVRSKYEQTCADFFLSKNITFQYEPLMLLGGKKYRPDFYLPDYNLFIEICGYNHFPHYSDRQTQKKEIYEKNDLDVIFIHYNGKGSLKQILEEELERFAGRISGGIINPTK